MEQPTPSLNPENSTDPRIRFDHELNEYRMDSEDGQSTFVWDGVRKGWFPMYRDDLISQQQSAYDIPAVPPTSESADPVGEDTKKNKKKRRPKPVSTQPVIKMSESTVYVSKLPLDIRLDEMESFFAKCGIILPDLDSGKPRIRLYTDEETGLQKGDGSVTYFKPESVDLAITILHESEIRPGFPVSVEKATFNSSKQPTAQEGPSNPDEHAKTSKIRRRKLNAQIDALSRHVGWDEDDSKAKEALKASRTVIIHHMFRPAEFENDPSQVLDLKEEVREECEKLGEVTTVTVYERNPKGIVAVRFKEEVSALACVKLMHARFFGGRKILAHIHDGVTKYGGKFSSKEDAESEAERLKNYEKWLDASEKDSAAIDMPANPDSGSDTEGDETVKATEVLQNDEEDNVPVGAVSNSFLFTAPGGVQKRLIEEKDREFEHEESYFDDEDPESPSRSKKQRK